MDANIALNYYKLVNELINAAGDYVGKVHLKENLEDESTACAVEHVLNTYYDGKMRNLDSAIKKRKKKCEDLITDINNFHYNHGIRRIQKPENLILLLRDESRRKKWKRLIEKHIKKEEFANVYTLEKEYLASFQSRQCGSLLFLQNSVKYLYY